MCFAAAWEICPAQRSCALAKKHRRGIFFEDTLQCRNLQLCTAASVDTLPPSSPDELLGGSACATTGGCLVCLSSDVAAWHCFARSQDDYGISCDTPANWTLPTAVTVFSERCSAIFAAAPVVRVELQTSAIESFSNGAVVLSAIQDALHGGAFTPTANGFELDLTNSSLTNVALFKQTLVKWLSDVCIAAGASVSIRNILLQSVTLTLLQKRQNLADYTVTFGFSLLKNDDPLGTQTVAETVVTGLAAGAVPGVDPVSIGLTPATAVQYNSTTSTNSTATPRPTDVARPRDPTSPLNGGAIFGIIFGSAVAAIAVCALFAYVFIKLRTRSRPPFDPARAS